MNPDSVSFLNGLDRDLQQGLIQDLRNLWTHSSTALEGNTLTLGETAFVLAEGLTISGKSLRDHQEVVGHGRAIDEIFALTQDASQLPKTAYSIFTAQSKLKSSEIF